MTIRRLLGKAALAAAGTAGSMLVRKGASILSSRRKRLGYQAGRATLKSKKELKAYDTLVNQAFNTTGGPPPITSLNNLVVGPEIYQRVGRKIYMKSLHFRGVIYPTVTSIQDFARIIILYDSNPNGSFPAYTGILKDSTVGAGTNYFSHLNLDNRERFKVLKDYQVMLPSVTVAAGALTNESLMDPIKNTLNVEWFIPLHGLEAVYNNVNGGTIADCQTGSIILMTISSNAGSYSLNGQFRLRYYD